jgi:hypothetical protein
VTGGIALRGLALAVSLRGSLRQPLIAFRDAEHQGARLGVMHLFRVNARLLGAAVPMLCVVDQAAFHGCEAGGAGSGPG